MAWYEIVVQSSGGRPVKNEKVCVGAWAGFSAEAWTDASGVASVEHSAGSVDVYVGGKKVRTGVGPGRHVVTL